MIELLVSNVMGTLVFCLILPCSHHSPCLIVCCKDPFYCKNFSLWPRYCRLIFLDCLKCEGEARCAFLYAHSSCVLLCVDAMVCEQYKKVALTVEHVTWEVEREEALLGQQPRLASIPLVLYFMHWCMCKSEPSTYPLIARVLAV